LLALLGLGSRGVKPQHSSTVMRIAVRNDEDPTKARFPSRADHAIAVLPTA